MIQESSAFGPVPERPGGFTARTPGEDRASRPLHPATPDRAPGPQPSPGRSGRFLVKGAAFLAHQAFLSSRFSVHELDRVRESLSPEDRDALFAKTVLPVSHVPLQAVINYVMAADRILGKSDLAIYKDSLRFKAQQELRGVYRVFMSFVSPHYIVKHMGSVWKHMYNQGETHAENLTPKSANMIITEVPDMPKYHDLAILTYVMELLRICGCKNPRGYIQKSISNGDDSVVIHLEWD